MKRLLARTLAGLIVSGLAAAVLLPIALFVGWDVFWWSLGVTTLILIAIPIFMYVLYLVGRALSALWRVR